MSHNLVRHDLDRCTLIAMPDEIDLANSASLYDDARKIVEERTGQLDALVMDLTATSFIDSSGLALITSLGERTRAEADAQLRVTARTPAVRRVLELVNLRRDVPVYDDLAEALLGRPTGFPGC